MANTRHTVVVRKDLNLSPGLLAAQVAHISDAFMRKKISLQNCPDPMVSKDIAAMNKWNENELDWFHAPYISVLAVNTREELEHISNQAKEANVPVHEWHDIIPSEVLNGHSLNHFIGISIGPDDFDKIKLITGTLPLF